MLHNVHTCTYEFLRVTFFLTRTSFLHPAHVRTSLFVWLSVRILRCCALSSRIPGKSQYNADPRVTDSPPPSPPVAWDYTPREGQHVEINAHSISYQVHLAADLT